MTGFKMIVFLLLFFPFENISCQEGIITDIKSCSRLFYIKDDLINQIKNSDTINYYHDEEIIIFYNKKKTKDLSPNTFYIINHGFNKLFTMNIRYIEAEGISRGKKKDTLIINPTQFIKVFYEDSLPTGSFAKVEFGITSSKYKKAVMKSYFVEIGYYDKTIYRWFLKESLPYGLTIRSL